jgi:hypothetical protein
MARFLEYPKRIGLAGLTPGIPAAEYSELAGGVHAVRQPDQVERLFLG